MKREPLGTLVVEQMFDQCWHCRLNMGGSSTRCGVFTPSSGIVDVLGVAREVGFAMMRAVTRGVYLTGQ